MKKILIKISDFLKKVAKWIIKNWKIFLIALGGAIALKIYKEIKTKYGPVKARVKWEEYPDDKTKVYVAHGITKKIVDLPINPNTGRQITSKNKKLIIGYPDNYMKGDILNVEIKHKIVNRRSIID